ncbi:MAG TPA: tetratricopeptide repeat protein [bacterium]
MTTPDEKNRQAVQLYKNQDLPGAEVLYREAIKLDPSYFPAQLNLGILLFKAGRYDDSIKECTKAVSLYPTHPSAHFHLGNAYYAKMWWEEAMVEYEKVFHLDPNHVDVHFALGGIYLNRGHKDKAVEYWRKYLELAPADSPKAKLAKEYVEGTLANQVNIGKYIAE